MFCSAHKDWWVNLVAIAAGVTLAGVGAWLVYTAVDVADLPDMLVLTMRTTTQFTHFVLLLGALMPLFGALLIWCLAATRYELSFQNLIVQSGPSLRRIPLATIVAARVVPGGLPRGPIWSRRMVRIDHRRGKSTRMTSIVISPRDPAGFLESLAKAAPGLKPQADGSLSLTPDTNA
jgi:hypothetical protein